MDAMISRPWTSYRHQTPSAVVRVIPKDECQSGIEALQNNAGNDLPFLRLLQIAITTDSLCMDTQNIKIELTPSGWIYLATQAHKQADHCANPEEAAMLRKIAEDRMGRASTTELSFPKPNS